MKPILLVIIILLLSCKKESDSEYKFDFTTTFEKSKGKETATYSQILEFYKALSLKHASISIDSVGVTDSGLPLHVVNYNGFSSYESDKHITLLINNGIHPGESDGIDASMMLLRDLAEERIEIPRNVSLAIIPVYNVGGCLNRNSATRTNQNGPKSYGFRGNARNYDLNRDFIKSDTRNAFSFAKLFHSIEPDVFIDNHVSNGADYQYTLTHLFTQHNKMGGQLGKYLHKTLMPKLETDLLTKDLPITPYVNVWGTTPESGWSQFMDLPRYSTGYTTLFHCLGMMVETHMLKPYKDRVEQTYELMRSMIKIVDEDAINIKSLKEKQIQTFKMAKTYPIRWKVDSTNVSKLLFKGYEAEYVESKITGHKRLYYDRSRPYEKTINYYNYIVPTREVQIPTAYVIPQNCYEVINLLKVNNIELHKLKKDTIINVESYRIESFNSSKDAYEGHYLHSNTEVSSERVSLKFRSGDYIVNTNQFGVRYLIETLEPEAMDSFFNWNYFDSILQQKEHFSPYVFEDKAEVILRQNPELKSEFDSLKIHNSEFNKNWYDQLDWIHKHSEHYESSHMQYPIFRIL